MSKTKNAQIKPIRQKVTQTKQNQQNYFVLVNYFGHGACLGL